MEKTVGDFICNIIYPPLSNNQQLFLPRISSELLLSGWVCCFRVFSSSEAFFCRPVSSWIPSAIHSFRTPSLNGLFKDTSSGWRREVRVWRKCSQYLSCELQMSRKQASSFSSPGHRSVHFYFLCCVFNVCKLGRAWQTIESVYNTHRDFDACFYGKKSAHYTRVNTVVYM